jgi:recombinational DNA repair protein RecT
LGKYGIMSVEMQKAYIEDGDSEVVNQADQAIGGEQPIEAEFTVVTDQEGADDAQ